MYSVLLWCVSVVSFFLHSHILCGFRLLQFPFFCSDREYIIGRRIWNAGNAYYCVTKVWNCKCMFSLYNVMAVCEGAGV